MKICNETHYIKVLKRKKAKNYVLNSTVRQWRLIIT